MYAGNAITFCASFMYEYTKDVRAWTAILKRYVLISGFGIGYEAWIMDVLPDNMKAQFTEYMNKHKTMFPKFPQTK